MENTNQSCIFSEPRQIEKMGQNPFTLVEPNTNNANFQFQKMICQSTTTAPDNILKISTTSGDIYFDRTISTTDVLLVVAILGFVFAGIMGFILRFIFKAGVSFKR